MHAKFSVRCPLVLLTGPLHTDRQTSNENIISTVQSVHLAEVKIAQTDTSDTRSMLTTIYV